LIQEDYPAILLALGDAKKYGELKANFEFSMACRIQAPGQNEVIRPILWKDLFRWLEPFTLQ